MATLQSLSKLQAAPTDTKATFQAAVTGAKPTSKRKSNPFKKLSADTTGWVKILAYGHSGSGKSYAIKGFLEAGLKILVISTDFGGSGLNTVINELQRDGKTALLDNVWNADFDTYDEVEAFLKDPTSVFPEIYDIDIDMIVWDGFSGFQQNHVATKVADIIPQRAGGGGVSEARESGLQMEMSDWGMIRNGTMRPLAWFLQLHNKVTGKRWHKYVTALESNKEDKLQNEKMTGPLLQGSAFSLIGPMFDIIFQAKRKQAVGSGEDKKPTYLYNCIGNEKLLAKTRGFDLQAQEPGDMRVMWAKIEKNFAKGPETPVTQVTETAS